MRHPSPSSGFPWASPSLTFVAACDVSLKTNLQARKFNWNLQCWVEGSQTGISLVQNVLFCFLGEFFSKRVSFPTHGLLAGISTYLGSMGQSDKEQRRWERPELKMLVHRKTSIHQ